MNTFDLRVAHLHSNPDWGGGENQVLALARRMHARGAFVVLATPPGGLLWRRARAVGLRVESLKRGRCARRALRDTLDEMDLHCLHAHDSGAVAIGGYLGRRLGIPLIMTRRIASPLRRNPLSRLKYGPRRLAAVVAISETVREVLLSAGYPAQRLFVAPSGVDIEALEALPRDADSRARYGPGPLIAGIGKLSEKKNWGLMIDTAKRLTDMGFAAQWLLIGDGPERNALTARVRELGLAKHFHLLGFRADAVRLLRQCDLLCFPSRMEGASVTVREAMAMGIPVVAADAPAVIESLAGHGWVVRADDPDAMAASVREALTRDEPCLARIAAARSHARAHYDFERMVDATLKAY